MPLSSKMDIETLRDYCLSKPGVTEGMPFGEGTLVFKVMDKLFALTGIDPFEFVNLKCDPERAVELRESHGDFIKPGYHMSKKHWNSVYNGAGDQLIFELVDHSYDLIVSKLSKNDQKELEKLGSS